MKKLSQIINYLNENFNTSTKDVATQLGVSTRHVRRAKAHMRSFKNIKGSPKILLVDIETLPMEVLVWDLRKQYIPPANIVKDWSILCWCAKWLYDDTIIGETVNGEEAFYRHDYKVVGGLHNLLDEANIVIAHNASRFDIPKINTRFILNGYNPVHPYQVIDTLTEARKHFAFSSNSLDELAKQLGLPRKKHAPYRWWYQAAVNGDNDAVQNIFDYCEQDIVVLEEVYTSLRPFIKSHPNYGLYIDTDKTVCPNCGNDNLDWGGFYYTLVGKYKSFKCQSCGSIGRSRFTEINKEKAKILSVSVAR